jgi:hypothetical protein
MTAMIGTLLGSLSRKVLRGIAVVIMLTVYGFGLIGFTGAASVATSTQADAGYRGRGRRGYGRRGRRGWWRGRRGYGRRGWGRRRGWWGPGFYIGIR